MKPLFIIICIVAIIVYCSSIWYQYTKIVKEEFEDRLGDYPQVYKNTNEMPCYNVPTSSPIPTSSIPVETAEPDWVSKARASSSHKGKI
jgi:hypothetical protein